MSLIKNGLINIFSTASFASEIEAILQNSFCLFFASSSSFRLFHTKAP